MRTILEIVTLILVLFFVYWYVQDSKDNYVSKTKQLDKKIDSLQNKITTSRDKIANYRDSVMLLDSLYKTKKNRRDSIKTVYVEKKIPAVDYFTVDSFLEYFRARYRKKVNSSD